MYGKLQSLDVRAGESIPAQPHFTPEFAEPGSGYYGIYSLKVPINSIRNESRWPLSTLSLAARGTDWYCLRSMTVH
jgi:hypothetical protein